MAPGVIDGSLLGLPHPMLDLGERLLDWIEIGGVFWQEPQPGSGGLDGVADGLGFMRAEIVENDDVAGLERRDQLLVHIGAKALAVDRAVKDAWSGEPIAA